MIPVGVLVVDLLVAVRLGAEGAGDLDHLLRHPRIGLWPKLPLKQLQNYRDVKIIAKKFFLNPIDI